MPFLVPNSKLVDYLSGCSVSTLIEPGAFNKQGLGTSCEIENQLTYQRHSGLRPSKTALQAWTALLALWCEQFRGMIANINAVCGNMGLDYLAYSASPFPDQPWIAILVC